MAFQPSPTDVSVIITTPGTATGSEPRFLTERRVTPTWSVLQLKSKLETMTGIPTNCQRLLLKAPGRADQWVDGDDSIIGNWGLMKGCEIEVHDTRPQAARPNFNDLSSVEKYVLPSATYESLPHSVLAWKKNQKLGRFDPKALSPKESMQKQAEKDTEDVRVRGIAVSRRAIILPSSPPHVRRGTIRYVGPVPTIPFPGVDVTTQETSDSGPQPIWVGVELDEPTGKNDGSVGGRRYFTCPNNTGVFVKPEKVEVGDFPPLDLFDDLDDEMEEI
ncbi:TBCB family protein [Aspergillus novofumigatus IBT 16806]|uniref:Putative cell polarity protein n=1 Tax=Aspergillus novofumigatus (strain IBT 16806) TaxID=1392255 RepID=A0A2I1CA63_ASPN1|nr:putative cell polarity protein [Aspergillus novofumigatus IBT 16806]PKX94519.1 putative cell polarity protein [Aspergillus novofumigatus IBT 16806]